MRMMMMAMTTTMMMKRVNKVIGLHTKKFIALPVSPNVAIIMFAFTTSQIYAFKLMKILCSSSIVGRPVMKDGFYG